MEKALFIHGLHSDKNSSTGKKVREVLEEWGYECLLQTFDVATPMKAKKEVSDILKRGEIELVVAHSLGAFYAFVSEGDVMRVLINPCLKAEEDPCKLLPQETKPLKEYLALKNEAEMLIKERKRIFALFGKNDELFSYTSYFEALYGRTCYAMMDCGHRPDMESLQKGLKIALEYLQK